MRRELSSDPKIHHLFYAQTYHKVRLSVNRASSGPFWPIDPAKAGRGGPALLAESPRYCAARATSFGKALEPAPPTAELRTNVSSGQPRASGSLPFGAHLRGPGNATTYRSAVEGRRGFNGGVAAATKGPPNHFAWARGGTHSGKPQFRQPTHLPRLSWVGLPWYLKPALAHGIATA